MAIELQSDFNSDKDYFTCLKNHKQCTLTSKDVHLDLSVHAYIASVMNIMIVKMLIVKL